MRISRGLWCIRMASLGRERATTVFIRIPVLALRCITLGCSTVTIGKGHNPCNYLQMLRANFLPPMATLSQVNTRRRRRCKRNVSTALADMGRPRPGVLHCLIHARGGRKWYIVQRTGRMKTGSGRDETASTERCRTWLLLVILDGNCMSLHG